jgi:hypothetical protein
MHLQGRPQLRAVAVPEIELGKVAVQTLIDADGICSCFVLANFARFC